MVLPEMIHAYDLSVTKIVKTEKHGDGIAYTLISNGEQVEIGLRPPAVTGKFESQLKDLFDWILDDIKQPDSERVFTELPHQLGVPEEKIEELFTQVLSGVYTSA